MALCAATSLGTAITGGLTLSYRSDFLDSGNPDAAARDTGTSLAVGTDAFLGVAIGTGVLAAIALIVHYARRRSGPEDQSTTRLTPSFVMVAR